MRHVRMLGLCLVAILAVAATATSSALALPEWGKCEAKAGGKYEDANCMVKAKGKAGKHDFEWTKGKNLANVPFSGKSVGGGGVLQSGLIQCEGGADNFQRVSNSKCIAEGGTPNKLAVQIKVECASETSSGEASGTKAVVNVHVTFAGCVALGSVPCNSAGAAEGEIKTNALKGELGYTSKAGKEVGVLLEPAQKHGRFAVFTCPGLENIEIVVAQGNVKEGAAYSPESHGGYDGIISPITPVNQMTSKFTQVYTVNEQSENVPNKFDGKHISLLEDYLAPEEGRAGSSKWSAAGEEITNVNTPSEPGEIKA